ncbi:hypothetical protein [Methylococcus capsulatus]|uniref:hypothetical protein n=1 Tax=Methylococcus capsulatus TaxID=414 RepID=UPI001C529AC2|nr:hypothetical protein [Methylococcus capsulatus]QXP89650.1 hypothetical protein KW114_11135 [Methylococcus capsulatus]
MSEQLFVFVLCAWLPLLITAGARMIRKAEADSRARPPSGPAVRPVRAIPEREPTDWAQYRKPACFRRPAARRASKSKA